MDLSVFELEEDQTFRDDPEYKDRIVMKINSGEFSGVSFVIGKISFPDENEPIMNFTYDVLKGSVSDVPKFEKFIGDSIIQMLIEGMKQNTIPYKGGV